jgi:sulfate/thiosulfate transport system substrate-binding protein
LHRLQWFSFVFAVAVVLASCGSSVPSARTTDGASASMATRPATVPASGAATFGTVGFNTQPGAVTLVAYSTPRAAYQVIIPLFRATLAGNGVEFEESYLASGDQSRAVEAGLRADVVAFSVAPDITRLVRDGIVASDWNSGRYRGMVTDSVVVFVVHRGNPKRIRTWDDLVRPGIQVIEPNPFTSGGARWNVMAAWGAQTRSGRNEDQAIAYLTALFRNVPVQDSSARAALQTFVGGTGDVMLAYENEAIQAQHDGQDFDYVIPDRTILIENPVAVTNVGDVPETARAFVDFLTTPTAQMAYAITGYRPVVPEELARYNNFPRPAGLFTIDDLGGWDAVTARFFDPTTGIVAEIEREIGITP